MEIYIIVDCTLLVLEVCGTGVNKTSLHRFINHHIIFVVGLGVFGCVWFYVVLCI
jgi:hypothetical protein